MKQESSRNRTALFLGLSVVGVLLVWGTFSLWYFFPGREATGHLLNRTKLPPLHYKNASIESVAADLQEKIRSNNPRLRFYRLTLSEKASFLSVIEDPVRIRLHSEEEEFATTILVHISELTGRWPYHSARWAHLWDYTSSDPQYALTWWETYVLGKRPAIAISSKP